MPRKAAGKGKGRGKTSQITKKKGEEGIPLRVTSPPPADESDPEIEKDVADSAADSVAAESVAAESVAGDSVAGESMAADVGDDERAAYSQPNSKKARVFSNLTENEQEDVALFLERNDFIYNKRRTDHTFVSKKNKAWENLAQELGKDVKALTTFFESIRTQMGKLRRKKSGQAAVEMTDRQQWIWTRFQFLLPHIGQVINRTVQSFRSSSTVSQGEESREEVSQSAVTTTPSTTAPEKSTATMSSNRGGRLMGAETLDKELYTCKDRQEKLLQILQAPVEPEVPHPEKLKFAEYLGHAFQNLPQSIYRDLQKSMFDLLYKAEKQADLEAARSAPAPPQQYQRWQPDPSQWQSRPVAPARSVWHSQEAAWVDRQFPGYTQSPSQEDLTGQTATYTNLVPPGESQLPLKSSSNPGSQEEASFSMSEMWMDVGPTAVATPVTETT